MQRHFLERFLFYNKGRSPKKHQMLGKVLVRDCLVISWRFMEARCLFCGRGLGRLMLKYFFGELEG